MIPDERGSIVAVTNASGTAIAVNSYDEYGITASTSPANMGRFLYTGQAWLPEVGLYYYKARLYSPTLGRFMQTDPIGYGDGVNWYNYVGSDPVNFRDPSGLKHKKPKQPKQPPEQPEPGDIVINGALVTDSGDGGGGGGGGGGGNGGSDDDVVATQDIVVTAQMLLIPNLSRPTISRDSLNPWSRPVDFGPTVPAPLRKPPVTILCAAAYGTMTAGSGGMALGTTIGGYGLAFGPLSAGAETVAAASFLGGGAMYLGGMAINGISYLSGHSCGF